MKWIKVEDDFMRWDTPKQLSGEYLRAEVRQSKLGTSTVHSVKNGHAGATKFYGTKVLDAKLAAVTPGSMVRIDYLGEKLTQRGTKYKDFDVYIIGDDDGDDKAV